MELTRRSVLGGLALAGLPGWRVQAFDLGDWEVITLSDGHLVLPAGFIFGPMLEAELAPLRVEFGLTGDTLTPPCNVTLVRRGDEAVLFDCGAGSGFQSTAGTLPDALAAIGVDPLDITHLVFTHGHPDHLWGVLDDFDDPLFAEARHLMGQAEREYWLNPETATSIGTERTAFAVGAARRLEVLGDRLEVFDDGAEILPGIAAQSTPGHTPGHMAFEIRNGSEAVMILGDAVSNGHVGFARPDWPSGSDQDMDLAAATRGALLDQVAQEQMTVIGFHLPEGGIGRVERHGEGFRFVPRDA